MVINGVSFDERLCLEMRKGNFIKAHEDTFFLDREIRDRRKILSDAYDVMMGDNNKGSFNGDP